MQYWLYAFKYYHGNILIGKYETLDEAKIGMDRLGSMSFEYEKGKTIVKRLIR